MTSPRPTAADIRRLREERDAYERALVAIADGDVWAPSVEHIRAARAVLDEVRATRAAVATAEAVKRAVDALPVDEAAEAALGKLIAAQRTGKTKRLERKPKGALWAAFAKRMAGKPDLEESMLMCSEAPESVTDAILKRERKAMRGRLLDWG